MSQCRGRGNSNRRKGLGLVMDLQITPTEAAKMGTSDG